MKSGGLHPPVFLVRVANTGVRSDRKLKSVKRKEIGRDSEKRQELWEGFGRCGERSLGLCNSHTTLAYIIINVNI